jgi:2-desacetyl-2-hydroxyethyl bacteriochlorophyllide A dehydrogenase
MGHKARAVVIHGPYDVRVDEVELPDLEPTDVRVRIRYTGLSVGTERCILKGQRPDTPFPVVSGYQSVGTVEEVGSWVKSVQPGDRVTVGTSRFLPPIHPGWGGHVEMAVLNADHVTPIPDNVGWEEAALERLAAVGLRGARMANIKANENVVIVGQGMIGNLLGQIARSWDAFVVASDLLPLRRDLARRYSADRVAEDGDEDLRRIVGQEMPRGADLVVEATGQPENIPLCLDLVREQGRILLQGWYPGNVCFDFHRAHLKRVTVFFPCYLEGEDVVLSMIERERLVIRPLITHVLAARDAAEAFRLILDEPENLMGVLLDWTAA